MEALEPKHGTGAPALDRRTMTPYASPLKADAIPVSKKRMAFATAASSAGYAGGLILSFELLAKTDLEILSLVIAGAVSGIVGALAVPVRSELDQRMIAGLRGVFLVFCVTVLVGVAVAIFKAQFCVAILFALLAAVIAVPGLAGAFFGVLTASALATPFAHRSRRKIRARRWECVE